MEDKNNVLPQEKRSSKLSFLVFIITIFAAFYALFWLLKKYMGP